MQATAPQPDIIEQATGWPRIPRPYQQDTTDFMLEVKDCIISHAPGLGKTLSASIAATQAMQVSPGSCTVIFCPTHLMRMWFDHWSKQHPTATIALCSSDTRSARLAVLQPGYDVYIINYQAMRSQPYYQAILALSPLVLILDESHNVKNPTAEQTKRVTAISQLPSVQYRFLITATPIKREADDLYSQLHIIDSLTYSSKTFFESCMCNADHTQYGARNVRLKHEYKTKLYWNNPRTHCSNTGTPVTPATREYDWVTRQYIDTPATNLCTCCPPYEYNTLAQKIEQPPDPTIDPNHLPVTIHLSDWLTKPTTSSDDELASIDTYKRRKPLTFQVHKPEPTYITTKARNPMSRIMGFSYADVGMWLPKLIPATILVPLDTETRTLYNQIKSTWRASIPDQSAIDLGSAMAALHALRVITCCDAKIDAIRQTIESAPDGSGHLVFAAYDMTAKVYADALGTKHIAGHIPQDQRSNMAHDLLRQGKPIVATLQILSEGIDLSDVKYVHYAEDDWTPGVNWQSVSRAQRNPTSIIRRTCSNPKCQHDLSYHEGTPGTFACQHVTQSEPTRFGTSSSQACTCTEYIGDPVVCTWYMAENTIDERVHEVGQDRSKNARDVLRVELAID